MTPESQFPESKSPDANFVQDDISLVLGSIDTDPPEYTFNHDEQTSRLGSLATAANLDDITPEPIDYQELSTYITTGESLHHPTDRAHQIIQDNINYMRRIVTAMKGKNPSLDTEEIIQDACIKILKFSGSIREIEATNGWVNVLTRKVVIDHINKARKSKQRITANTDSIPEEYHPTVDIEPTVDQIYLGGLLENLDSNDRELLNLFAMRVPYSEIAVSQGTNENTVKTRIRRALNNLRHQANI